MRARFRFEKLDVWQEARIVDRAIYKPARQFPKDEMFAMTSPVKRAAISISSHIAEGSGRNSDDRDFGHFLEQEYGSPMETASRFYLAPDENFVSEDDLDGLLENLEMLARRIVSLHHSLKISASKTPFARPSPCSRPSTVDSRPS